MTLLKKHKYVVTLIVHSDSRLDYMDVFHIRDAVNKHIEMWLEEKVIVEVVGRMSIDCEQVALEIEMQRERNGNQ